MCAKETFDVRKADLLHTQKRPITPTEKTYYTRKRDLSHTQKRPIMHTCMHTYIHTYELTEETYYTRKRDPLADLTYLKSENTSKETYHIRKRDLLYTQKRPTGIPKVGKHVAGLALSSWAQVGHHFIGEVVGKVADVCQALHLYDDVTSDV